MGRRQADLAALSLEKSPPAYPIGSVDSALRLVMLVADRGSLRIPEAARELQVARSTAHRLMQMLEYRDFVSRDTETRAYVPGPVLMNLGLQMVRDFDVRAVARPHLEQLVADVGETGLLLSFGGTELTCIDAVESPRALRVGSRVGMVLTSHGSAGGRALLSQLAPDRLRQLYPTTRLPESPTMRLASWPDLIRELEVVRRQGYAVQSDETEPGVSAIGVAIPDPLAHPKLAVVVAIPTSRLGEHDIAEVAGAAQRCASAIAAVLPG